MNKVGFTVIILLINLHIHMLYPYYKMIQINSGQRIFILSIVSLGHIGKMLPVSL